MSGKRPIVGTESHEFVGKGEFCAGTLGYALGSPRHGESCGQTRAATIHASKVRRELERRTEPELHPINLDPYPATVGEVADEIARYVLELESGPARGLLHRVIGRLTATAARRDDGIAEHASNAVDSADFY